MEKICKYNKLISLFLDEELPENEALKFQGHIKTCPECRKELEMLKLADSAVSDMAEIEPSDDFDRNFWKKIDEIESKKARWSIPFDIFLKGFKPQFAAAFSVILVAGIIFFENRPFEPGADDLLIAENLELFQDYETINHLDLLENWESFMEEKENT